jgi:2-dehydropantoate 2-reductase
VLEDASRRLLAERAAREVAAVAAASGVALPGDAAEEALAVARRTAGNRSSMRQDLARHAPTEIEFLNGAVVREGLRLGVPTPVNAWLANEVRERELAAVSR